MQPNLAASVLKARQVGALLELSEPAVRKRLERARSALRDKVERFGALAIPARRNDECDGYKLIAVGAHNEWTRRGVRDGDVLQEAGGKSLCQPGWQEALSRSKPGDLLIRRGNQQIHL